MHLIMRPYIRNWTHVGIIINILHMDIKIARKILMHLKLTRELYCQYNGQMISLDYVLSVLYGRRVTLEEALDIIS